MLHLFGPIVSGGHTWCASAVASHASMVKAPFFGRYSAFLMLQYCWESGTRMHR